MIQLKLNHMMNLNWKLHPRGSTLLSKLINEIAYIENVWCNDLLVVVQLQVMSVSFLTPWTVAHQSPLSMGFPRQEYRNQLLFPSPGALSDLGIKPMSSALAGVFFTTEPSGFDIHIQLYICIELLSKSR